MLLPWAIGYLTFILGPLLFSFGLVFAEYDVFSPPRFVGLDNVVRMVESDRFWNAWRVTMIYAGIGTLYTLILGFGLALLLYHTRRLSGFWRTLFYMPTLLAGTAEALVIGQIWNPSFGLVNVGLGMLGIEGPRWLQAADSALPALILMRYWTIGNVMLLFLGARSNVPEELHEAARIDGAGRWKSFVHVSFPMMSPIILFNLVLGLIASLQAFTQVFILTRGGPQRSTELIGLQIYFQAFEGLKMGLASAMSWSLFGVTLLLTVLLIYSGRRWVYYASE